MDNSEMISVITLTYNKFEHLAQTIKSVLAQDYPRIEYIIADDASESFPEEQVMELLQTYRKSNIVRFRLLRNETNVGTVKNVNHVYQTASGKYMVNLSCGDVFFETSTLSKIAERFQSSGCHVLVASRMKYGNDLKPICFMPHYNERALIQQYDTPLKQYKAFILGIFRDMASGSAMYYTRDIIEEMGYFDERYLLWEDGPFLAKYLWEYPLEFAYDIISIWYESDGMSSSTLHPARPLLLKDSQKFWGLEAFQHFDAFTVSEKKRLLFRAFRLLDRGVADKCLTSIRFLPEWISYRKYSASRKKEFPKDQSHIRTALNSPDLIDIRTL